MAHFSVLQRENVGFDFGAHAAVLNKFGVSEFDYFVFLNSGVVGPFVPAYMPKSWHWTEAFVDKLSDRVALCGTSIACMDGNHMRGPRVEGFAFAMTSGSEDGPDKGEIFPAARGQVCSRF